MAPEVIERGAIDRDQPLGRAVVRGDGVRVRAEHLAREPEHVRPVLLGMATPAVERSEDAFRLRGFYGIERQVPQVSGFKLLGDRAAFFVAF